MFPQTVTIPPDNAEKEQTLPISLIKKNSTATECPDLQMNSVMTSCSAREKKLLKQVIKTAQWITGSPLPCLEEINSNHLLWKAKKIEDTLYSPASYLADSGSATGWRTASSSWRDCCRTIRAAHSPHPHKMHAHTLTHARTHEHTTTTTTTTSQPNGQKKQFVQITYITIVLNYLNYCALFQYPFKFNFI